MHDLHSTWLGGLETRFRFYLKMIKLCFNFLEELYATKMINISTWFSCWFCFKQTTFLVISVLFTMQNVCDQINRKGEYDRRVLLCRYWIQSLKSENYIRTKYTDNRTTQGRYHCHYCQQTSYCVKVVSRAFNTMQCV